jgi:Na+-translocating ferredoxin:NAD+ oxidoreductase RnfE subunit
MGGTGAELVAELGLPSVLSVRTSAGINSQSLCITSLLVLLCTSVCSSPPELREERVNALSTPLLV